MKIYFNTYPAAFQCPGGGEIQLLKSKEALERRGHEVVLFNQWEHSLADADVVHQFSVQGGVYNLSMYAHNHQIPLVLSPILWLSDYIDQYPMSEIGLMCSIADVICPNSKAEVDKFRAHFGEADAKYFVTHNGVDADFFIPVPGALFLERFQIKQPFILCVGNIEPRKNQISLIDAAAKIGAHVVLIGGVRDNAYYSRLEAKHAGKYTYVGHLEHASELLKSAYAACTAFALPSLLETPGLAALEAAAAGAPLVITSEGCTYEYFGDAALYVSPHSVDDIADKLKLAIEGGCPASNSASLAGRFTWDHVGLELERAYAQAIDGVKEKRILG